MNSSTLNSSNVSYLTFPIPLLQNRKGQQLLPSHCPRVFSCYFWVHLSPQKMEISCLHLLKWFRVWILASQISVQFLPLSPLWFWTNNLAFLSLGLNNVNIAPSSVWCGQWSGVILLASSSESCIVRTKMCQFYHLSVFNFRYKFNV